MTNPAPLGGFETDLWFSLLDYSRQTGRTPAITELAAKHSLPAAEIAGALRRLDENHHLVLDDESGEILMAFPFSAVPTAFRVESGERGWWANCVWDALGIAALFQQDARASTACPCCNHPLQLEVKGGSLAANEGVVHFTIPARQWWDDVVFT